MTVEEIIDEARDFHDSFSPEAHPDIVCLRAVARAEPRFYRDVIENQGESALALEKVFDAADIEFALAGEALDMPAYLRIMSPAIAATDAGIYPVDLAEDEVTGRADRRQIVVMGSRLLLAQSEDLQFEVGAEMRTALRESSRWDGTVALRVRYVPSPDPVTAVSQDLTAPERARDYLVGAVVRLLANRRAMSPMDKSAVIKDAEAMMASVIQSYTLTAGTQAGWYVSS